MSEPRWLAVDEGVSAHAKQLKKFGGPAGTRDQGALESALSRPVNKFHFGESDLAAQAAA